MFEELYVPLYAALPDRVKYLERIGVDVNSVTTLDRETLNKLVLAHQRTVPFENLDVYDAEIDVSLAIHSLYEKIVTNKRGGYCFELNAAFMALLQGLGYDCYAVAVRVVWGATRFMPVTHRATIVKIKGERYFCDVGFGGPSPQGAIKLDYTGEQPSGSNVFVIEKGNQGTIIHRVVEGKKEQLLMFTDLPVDPIDFIALNEYQSKSKYSGFKMIRMLNLVTETGSITLNGNVLRIHDNGDTTEKILNNEAEIKEALKEYFGLIVDYALKETIAPPPPQGS